MCDNCQDSGLQPIFEHTSYPVHAPAEKHVRVEPFDFDRGERQWEQADVIHQLLEAFTVCACPAGQRRIAAAQERKQAGGNRGKGWQPRRTEGANG